MTTRSYSLPLSRWHHVADRIRLFGETRSASALQVLQGPQIRTTLSDVQIEALRERGAKALADLGIARDAVRAVASIRERLAVANAEFNVNSLLAQAEGKRKEASLLRSVSAIDLVTKVPLEGVNAALTEGLSVEKTVYGQSQNGVRPSLVATNALASFEDEAALLDSEVAALTDAVADLNRNTLSIELPVFLATAAGLK